MRPCGIGFSLCVFPGGGSPGFQSGGARLQACGKSASTRRASESVWQLPFRVRARFQPCRNCRQINKALAAGGLPFQLPHRLFSTALRSRSPPLFVFSSLVYPEPRGATRLPQAVFARGHFLAENTSSVPGFPVSSRTFCFCRLAVREQMRMWETASR